MGKFDHLTDEQLRELRNALIAKRRGRKPDDYDRMTRQLESVWEELGRRHADT